MNRSSLDRMGPVDEDLEVAKLEQVLRGAFRKLSPNHKGAVIDACGYNLAVTDPVRVERLKAGLGQLAQHWNIVAKEVCEHKHKTI